ncbi:MAG: F0F1 ATP synthase subunit B [Syntrophobacterales bacterium]|jgi:F-type H+-transporting ATPase subunit b|nr:F0F1 ATP synthase subunit B [Syntrophobacterales bacterium]
MKRSDFRSKVVRFVPAAFFLSLLLASVSVAAGGGGGDSAALWKGFAWSVLNVSILVGLLVWLLAGRIKAFFSGRRSEIKNALEEAERAKRDAEQKFREYEEKLAKATAEIAGIVEMIKSQGMVERDKILADAHSAAEKMKEDTKARMDQELAQARRELREEAVSLSVQMAEGILQKTITPADHENMVKDYLSKVVIKH